MTDELTIKIKASSWARVTRELDEALEKLSDWENSAKHVESDHPDEVHCGCVPVLRKLLSDARKERDEARAECLEQCRLLAMSADREAKLLGELERAKKSVDHSTWVHGVCNPPSPDWEKSKSSQMYWHPLLNRIDLGTMKKELPTDTITEIDLLEASIEKALDSLDDTYQLNCKVLLEAKVLIQEFKKNQKRKKH
jgi:hypothetical protein